MKNFDFNSFMSTELLKTAKGGKKESIYKNEIFAEIENKKGLRTKLRKLILNYCASIVAITDEKKEKALAKDFLNFYLSVYKINDFSLASICSANTDETKKDVLKKGIEKFNALLNSQKKK